MQTTQNEVHAWSSLNTVTKFDAGTTLVVGKNDSDLALQEIKPSSPISLLVQSLVEQLCRLMAKNPQHQKRLYRVICEKLHEMNLIDQSYNVEEYEFMRSYYQKSLIQLVSVAKSVIVGSNDSNIVQLPRMTLKSYEMVLSSRYKTDYEEVEYIARGGFGHVYRVRNILDGMEYAVKKICMQCQNINIFLQNLREVKMLARLHHPNIVAYKAAWVEPVSSVSEAASRKFEPPSSNDDSSSIVFEDPSHKEDSNNNNCACESEEKSDTSISAAEESNMSAENMVCKYQGTQVTPWNSSWDSAILYVQMQLCERTLRQWLDERNSQEQNTVDVKQSAVIFQQIVQGVNYIHSQGIVHHDIKPSNIFISSDLSQVQVGDFGLACWLQHTADDVALVSDTIKHRGEIGTKLYAAPEQIRGKCDPKSDLYSLGIVLFELLQPFKTDMERCKMIDQLRAGNIPPDLTVLAPKWAQLISHLMKRSPNFRPSITELQEMLVPLIKETNEGSESIDMKNETIQQLLAVISQRDREIEELQKRVRDLETKTVPGFFKD